eukprot:CAMPEP_0173377996 /NCGR_PEP_ID=MMETSP1356-20130122/1232_1 /TAXON_ID=77927 ORGANISM="Hemiselmis virescens, Strain PCC157" /NCGR_SAMPLE_ID=MMETSP1356 /ASSEMBLY_ACC=CAM_ASM_000847 /LENGTH=423 /DNA_ID=CAMNT_0014330937 /DNA_START=28 /DNA_END=1299 /DNA_ORIENTATION=-
MASNEHAMPALAEAGSTGGFSEDSIAKIKISNVYSPEPGASPLQALEASGGPSSPMFGGGGFPPYAIGTELGGGGMGGGTSTEDWSKIDGGLEAPLRSRPRSALRKGPELNGDLNLGPTMSMMGGVKFTGPTVDFPDSPTLPSPASTSPLPWNSCPIKPQKVGGSPVSPLGGVVPLLPASTAAGARNGEWGTSKGSGREARSLNHFASETGGNRSARGMSPIIQRRRALHQTGPDAENAQDLYGAEDVSPSARGVPEERGPDREVLEQCAIIKPLDPSARATLLASVRHHWCTTGFNVIEQGEPGASIFIVASGTCQAICSGQPSIEYPSSSFFGEVSLMEAVDTGKVNTTQEENKFETFGEEELEEPEVGTRTATVVALTDCSLYEIDPADAARLLQPCAEAWSTLRMVAEFAKKATPMVSP